MLQPQQLICTVERGSLPIVEVWFVGGRGTAANPLEVEVLGDLDVEAAELVVTALERLLDSHGPFLTVDLSAVEHIDADGFVTLSGLQARATSRQGRVLLSNSPQVGRHLDAATHRHPAPDEDRVPTMAPAMSAQLPLVSRIIDGGVDGIGEVLHLHGELDSDNAAALGAELRRQLAGPARDVVIDLGDVSFIDSTVISSLVRLHADVRERGGRVTLRNPTRPVRRVLEITGLLDVFGVG